jgi:hypothetical protein
MNNYKKACLVGFCLGLPAAMVGTAASFAALSAMTGLLVAFDASCSMLFKPSQAPCEPAGAAKPLPDLPAASATATLRLVWNNDRRTA